MRDAARTMICTAGERRFAIELGAIVSVLRYAPVTPVPSAPPFLHGMAPFDQGLVTVLDLGALFDGAPSAITSRSCIVFARDERCRGYFGMLVDCVRGMVEGGERVAVDESAPESRYVRSSIRDEAGRQAWLVPAHLHCDVLGAKELSR